jgi:hypothetical protein
MGRIADAHLRPNTVSKAGNKFGRPEGRPELVFLHADKMGITCRSGCQIPRKYRKITDFVTICNGLAKMISDDRQCGLKIFSRFLFTKS